MLVLARRVGEEIVINGNIRVSIAAIKGRQVRLAISAPLSVEVFRRELLEPYPEPPAGRDVTQRAEPARS